MSFGLVVRSASNQVVLDTSKQTWSYLGFFIAPAGQTTQRQFPAIHGMQLIAMQHLLNDIPTNQEVVVHSLYVSGNMVSASGGTISSIVTVLGR